MWPYGTMSGEHRAKVESDLAQSDNEQERAFLQQMLAIDDKARNTPGVGIVIPAAGEPSWLSLGVGVEEADRAIAAVVGERVVTPLFRVISKTDVMGFEGCYLIHSGSRLAFNERATGLRSWSRNTRTGRGVPAICGDAVFVHVYGLDDVYTGEPGEYRFDDISQHDANFPGFFKKYVRGNPNWWPRTPYKED